jgi:hypothetical protein
MWDVQSEWVGVLDTSWESRAYKEVEFYELDLVIFLNLHCLRRMLVESSFVNSIMNIGIHSRDAFLPEPNFCHIGNFFIPIRGVLSLVLQALIVHSPKKTDYLVSQLVTGCLTKLDSVRAHKNVRRFFFRSLKKESCFSPRHQSMGLVE